MFKDLRTRLAFLWVAAVIVIAACSVVYDVTFTLSTASLWLVAVLIPPSVMLLVWPMMRRISLSIALP